MEIIVSSIAICVPTYKRRQGLKALLASLDELMFPGFEEPEITIVLIDNDAEHPIAEQDPNFRSWSRYNLIYAIEPVRGVVAVRNRALSLAPTSAEFIAFIDDDEVASPQWLVSLLHVQQETGATVVFGPVRPRFENPPKRWMVHGRFYELGPYVDGAAARFAISGNALVKRSAIDRLGLRFDPAFAESGGEDQEFFHRIAAAGYRIVTAEKAIVYETVPSDRMKLGWILKRQFRIGTTLAQIDVRSGRIGLVALRVGKAGARVAFGVIELVTTGVFSRSAAVRGLTSVARGMGSLAGLAGIRCRIY